MNPTQTDVDRAVAAARTLESQGYFVRVKAGDQRAASYFTRMVAYEVNPSGNPSDFGCLSKTPGETQVDGFAEDALCFGNNPADRQNAVDMINGAGAPNASIGGGIKERRENNLWVKPVPLTADQVSYLLNGGQPQPIPPPPPSFPYPDEGTAVLAFQNRVKKAYTDVGRIFPDPNDSDAYRHFSRYGYSCKGMPEPDAANKHIKELRAQLGAPPE